LNEIQNVARRLFILPAMMMLPLALSACGGGSGDSAPAQDGQAGAQPLSDEAQALVAQGNEAQRNGQYQEALDYFSEALEIHPDHAVPQFGSLMAATAVGDTALARTLREKLAVTGPELLEMLGPGGGMGGAAGGVHSPDSGMPPGHPEVEIDPESGDTVPPINRAG
jgi:tetratricopeptide (TPR) repeat protein